MTIDETLDFADKIYNLMNELEEKFFDRDTYPYKHTLDCTNPVRHDCIYNLYRAYKGLHEYALGFKEMQFAQ